LLLYIIMVKTTKTTKTPVSETPAAAPAVSAAAAAPAADKASKAKKVPAVKVEASAAPATSAAPAVDDAAAPVEVDSSLIEQSGEFLVKLQQLGALIASLKTEYRVLEKKWTRDLKVAQKQSSKRKRKAGTRAPSGFVKPTRISDELATFLAKPSGTEMARTEVTRDINKYIRDHNLQDKENGRKINPDSKLASLLKVSKVDVLTYFNLQRYMSPHFAKAGDAAAAAAAATATATA
jgi:chromatin remodeling complex protein RSC6